VVPAAIAFSFTDNLRKLALIAWAAGLVASASGIAISFRYDLPTGPLIVVMFGLLLLVALLGRERAGRRSA
jgi:ABC-type Mn2+/Zn2+ transport system permease subunit